MDVLMTQRRPVTRLQRQGVVQATKTTTTTRPAAPALPPPQAVHSWMVPAAPERGKDRDGAEYSAAPSSTRAALAYRAAKTAVSVK